jgi:hypothetical protein
VENYGWRKANVLCTIYYDKINIENESDSNYRNQALFRRVFFKIIRFAMAKYVGSIAKAIYEINVEKQHHMTKKKRI